MDTVAAALASRSLLEIATNQSPAPDVQSPPDSSTNLPKAVHCSGSLCLVFNILVVVIILFAAALIFAFALYKRWRMSRAIKRGSIPAKFLISQWTVPPSERADLAAFAFPVHQPKNREDINEEECPICLKPKPKPTAWLVFGACNHATCNSCFKKLVAEKKLHAPCPICRTLLAQGEGSRGGSKPKPETEEPVVVRATEMTTPAATEAEAPLPPSANNV
jgi:Zinc finger, C3HC4 type (RING finger)